MKRIPRGFCLIINNIDFDHPFKEVKEKMFRYGSKVDADNLEKLFKSLLFAVQVKENLTSFQMKAELENFSSQFTKDHQMCIVIILSHGKNGQITAVDFDRYAMENVTVSAY